MEKYQKRSDIPDKYKWDLTEYCKSNADFREQLTKLKNDIKLLKNYAGLLNKADKLKSFLDLYIELIINSSSLDVYAYLKYSEDLGNNESIKQLNEIESLINDLYSETTFFKPELMSLDKATYDTLVSNELLKKYQSFLDDIYRFKDHVLSDNEEKIVTNLVGSVNNFENLTQGIINSQNDYGKIKIGNETEAITSTNYRRLIRNENENIRKNVYHKFMSKLDQYGDTFAANLNSFIKLNIADSKIHHYDSPITENLFSKKINHRVYENLNKVAIRNIASYQKYLDIKKKANNLKTLHGYDMSLSVFKNDRIYEIDEGIELIKEALKPLGSDYLNKFLNVINNHHIDFCEHKGKMNGGYCCNIPKKNPRILLSYNYDFESISTIAHEAGHDVNHQYINEFNDAVYCDNDSIVAEVASLTNECLLNYSMINKKDDLEAYYTGYSNFFTIFVINFYGTIREAKIEEDMYQYVLNDGVITKSYLNDLVKKSYEIYAGNHLKLDDLYVCNWIPVSHYFRPFYLYSYAISISVAVFIANEIIKGNKEMLNKYMEFLKTGSNKTIEETFMILDIDINDEMVFEKAALYFDEMIDNFIKLRHESGDINE